MVDATISSHHRRALVHHTSFANPAVTIAGSWSDSFAGIAPSSVPAFASAQLAGGLLGYLLVGHLYSLKAQETAAVSAPTTQRSGRPAGASGGTHA